MNLFEKVEIDKEDLISVAHRLKNEEKYDFFLDLLVIDYPQKEKRFALRYVLYSSLNKSRKVICVSIKVDENVESLTKIWRGAVWAEREAYDMFGVVFLDHPDLRRLLMPCYTEGYPLRKDYKPKTASLDLSEVFEKTDFIDQWENYLDENQLVNFEFSSLQGPTKGQCKIDCAVSGEKIHKANVEIGLQHRSVEKIVEEKSYYQIVSFMDRLNYQSSLLSGIGYCKAIEKSLGIEVPARAQKIRLIVSELSRISDHLVCLSRLLSDVGVAVFSKELMLLREMLLGLFERLCGARVIQSYSRIGGVSQDVPAAWFERMLRVCRKVEKAVFRVDQSLSRDGMWLERSHGVGVVSAQEAIEWGFTGPCLRASGVGLDLRKADPYYGYDELNFSVPIGTTGDVFDRYKVRMEEINQSLSLLKQVGRSVPNGDYLLQDRSVTLPKKKDVYVDMLSLQQHFALITEGIKVGAGEYYDSIESSNGELGFYIVSNGGTTPYRLKVRAPSFYILQSLEKKLQGSYISDIPLIIGSMNPVSGEVDR